MLYSSGTAASAAVAVRDPALPPCWPQFGQKRASSANCEPQFVQNGMSLLLPQNEYLKPNSMIRPAPGPGNCPICGLTNLPIGKALRGIKRVVKTKSP